MPKPDINNLLKMLENPERTPQNTSDLQYQRFFNDGYNGIKTSDLENRGISILDALLSDLQQEYEKNKSQIEALEKEKIAFLKFISSKATQVTMKSKLSYGIDIDNTFKLYPKLSDKNSDARREYVTKAIQITDTYISQLLNRIAAAIKKNEETYAETLKRIAKIEANYISAKERPTIITEFVVSPEILTASSTAVTLFSAQTPIGYLSERQVQALGKPQGKDPIEFTHTSKKRDTEGSANFVEENDGIIIDEHAVVKSTLLRGAWVPIDIKDPIKRRAIAERNLSQELEYIFNKNARENKYTVVEEPYQVNLSSISLLSMPGLLDLFDPDHQLGIAMDNHHVIQMLNGSVIEINQRDKDNKLIRDMEGKPIKSKIKVTINEMIMGVNFSRSERFSDPRQEQINTRSFNELWGQVAAYVNNEENSSANAEIKKLFNDIDEATRKLESPSYDRLRLLYDKLKIIQDEYEKTLKDNNSQQANLQKKLYQQTMKQIEKENAKLDTIQGALLAKRQSIWDEAKVEEQLSAITDPNLYELLANFNDIHYLFRNKLHFATDPDDNYQFQMRYVIINQRMGNPVHAACKSIEDRTGILANKVITYYAYKQIMDGKIPRYFPVKERQVALECSKKLEGIINEFSTSIENTGLNAPGSRGLQVRNKNPRLLGSLFGVLGDGNSFALQKEGMQLAKREKAVYKKAMTLSLWFSDKIRIIRRKIGLVVSANPEPKLSIQASIKSSATSIIQKLSAQQFKQKFSLKSWSLTRKTNSKVTVGKIPVRGQAAAAGPEYQRHVAIVPTAGQAAEGNRKSRFLAKPKV